MRLFQVGDRVVKIGGDYTLEGEIRGIVVKCSGAVRYVVEDGRGLLLIYSERQLAPAGGEGGGRP